MPRRTRPARGMALAVSIAAVTAVAAPGAAHAGPATAKAAQRTPVVDFNGDGHADLAAGAPDGTVGSVAAAGYVSVVYGAAAGVDPAEHAVISQNSPGVPGAAESGDHFGSTVVPVDLNGDGYTDLAVGTPGEDIGAVADAGTVTVLWGTPAGLTGTGTANFGSASMGAAAAGAHFGASLSGS